MSERLSNSMNNDLGQGYLNESFASMQSVYTYSNQNLSSLVNMPQTKTSQMLEGFRSMITSTKIYKQIEDKGSKIFTGRGSTSAGSTPVSEQTLNKINIDISEFNDYKERIQNELFRYMNQKRQDQESMDILQTINLNEVLLRCYKNVPSIYFYSDFHFDFKAHLSRDVNQMNETQDQISEYLEEVDINLFYQIQTRFNQFLSIILDLNEMQSLIDDSLKKIYYIRQCNLVLKQKLVQKGSQIVTMKKRIDRCQSVLAYLQLVQTLHKSLPSITTLINAGKFDFAVTLLHQSEAEYNKKFQKMIALNQFRDQIFLNRQKLENNISKSFQDKSLDYIISELNFIKEPTLAAQNQKSDMHSADNSFDDSSYMNSTLMNETFENNQLMLNLTQMMNEASKNPQLKWQHTTYRRDKDLEEQISKIVNQSYDLDKFNNQAYRRKLIEMLKGFKDGFISDMQDFQNEISNTPGSNKQILGDMNGDMSKNENQKMIFENMSLDLFVKFVLFYFEILKRVALKQIGLNHTILNSLVTHVITNLLKSGKDLDDNINAFSKLTSCVDDIYQNVIQVFNYINSWIDDLIKQKKLDNEVNFVNFRKVSKIFTFWDDFLANDLSKYFQISQAPFENIQSCKDSKEFRKFFRKFNEYHTKVQLKSLENIRGELEKKFLDQFHKKQLKDLKEILNNEKWTPVDINFEFYDIISYIVQNPKHEAEQVRTAKSSFDEDEEENKHLNDEVLENKNEDESNINDLTSARITKEQFKRTLIQIKIIKNQITYKNSAYKLTSAFLHFLKMIYEYLHLIDYFKSMRESSSKKLIELLKFYNSYANELIIGGGAFQLGVQITAGNLALSSLCLQFALKIFPQMTERIIGLYKDDSDLAENIEDQFSRLSEEYNIHNINIQKTISDILNKVAASVKEQIVKLQWNQANALKIPSDPTNNTLKSYRQMYIVLSDFYDKDQLLKIYATPLNHLINTYLPIFNSIQITNRLGAQRIKEELDYAVENIKDQDYIKLNSNIYSKFEEMAEDIIHERCIPFLQGNQEENE
ncbi:hypothetical protein ABPG74_000454 [Tetrahymena malaccensis]